MRSEQRLSSCKYDSPLARLFPPRSNPGRLRTPGSSQPPRHAAQRAPRPVSASLAGAWPRSGGAPLSAGGARLVGGAGAVAEALLDRCAAVVVGVVAWAAVQPAAFASFHPASWAGQVALAATCLAAGLTLSLEVRLRRCCRAQLLPGIRRRLHGALSLAAGHSRLGLLLPLPPPP